MSTPRDFTGIQDPDGEPLERLREMPGGLDDRPDRGWRSIGEIAREVLKATVVKAAMNGSISYERADEIVGAGWLRGA